MLSDLMKGAMDANTLATLENTAALRAMALSPSGGGGSGGGFGGYARAVSAFGGGTDMTDGWSGPGEVYNDPLMATAGYGTPEFDAQGNAVTVDAPAASGGGMSVGKGVGYAAAGAAAAYGAYRGFSKGGAQGALMGTGAILGAASMIPGPQQPFVMAAAMATTLIAGILGDPRQRRSDELSSDAQARAYTMPTGADYSIDAGGRYTDYDYTGRSRSVTVINNVYAMDSTSFRDFLIANPNALSAGLTSAIQGGNADDVVGSLAARSN